MQVIEVDSVTTSRCDKASVIRNGGSVDRINALQIFPFTWSG